jgi:hypothetical protein
LEYFVLGADSGGRSSKHEQRAARLARNARERAVLLGRAAGCAPEHDP